MKFILDANIPYSAKGVFSRPDEVVHVRDVGLDTASDWEILAWALRGQALIVTRDLDFANLVLHPLDTHIGAIVLRVPPSFVSKDIKDVLSSFLADVDQELLTHAITIVEPGRYRTRRKK